MDESTSDRILNYANDVRLLHLERLKLQRAHDLAKQGKTMRDHSAGLLARAVEYVDSPEDIRNRAAQYRGIARAYMAITLATREPDVQVAATIAQQIAELIETATMWEARAVAAGAPVSRWAHSCTHDVEPSELVVCVHGMTCPACFRSYCDIGRVIALAEGGV